MRVVFCDGCGGPMDAPWTELVMICQHCDAQNLPDGDRVPLRVPVDGRPRVNLGGRTYVVESRLAEGDSSVVYRARWVVRLGELVVLKVLQCSSDADLMRSEVEILRALHASRVEGARHFVRRVPQVLATGLVETDRPRLASVFAWQPGFAHTLSEVGNVHSSGVKGEVVVWLLKRLLELLDFVHRSGFVHGAVTPDHILVQPRDHGAQLVGWTAAQPYTSRNPRQLRVQSRTWKALYPHLRATPALDISMACRCVQAVAGWHLADAIRRPALQALLTRGAEGAFDSAWHLRDELIGVSKRVFGPSAYHPLPMPGWAGGR